MSRSNISVRSATIYDTSAILNLGRRAFNEVQSKGVPMYPEDEALMRILTEVITNRFCFVAIDNQTTKAVGCMAAHPIQQWWSSKWVLQQTFWFVTPKYRSTRAASMLTKAVLIRAREVNLPFFAYLLNGDEKQHEAMKRFMARFGMTYVGSNYVTPFQGV